jgi:hypothetical protein
VKLSADKGILASRRGVYTFSFCVKQTSTIARRPGSDRPFKKASEVQGTVEKEMQADDETTVKELQKTLVDAGHTLSSSTTLGCRSARLWDGR